MTHNWDMRVTVAAQAIAAEMGSQDWKLFMREGRAALRAADVVDDLRQA